MKVWVVYADMGYDGYSHPLAAFSSKEKAVVYCNADHKDIDEDVLLEWEELEVDTQ
jgi:hypothetical protein